MNKGKSSISRSKTYKQISNFWDGHDLSRFWKYGYEEEFDVNIESEIIYYTLNKNLSKKIKLYARKNKISPHTLINSWLQEKLKENNI